MPKVDARSLGDAYLDDGIKGWIVGKARLEHWRLAGWYEVSDLIQDGYMCYCKCRNHYALQDPDPGEKNLMTANPTKDQRKHFMALFKTTYHNHIMTLAAKFSAGRAEELVDDVTINDEPLDLENFAVYQEEISLLMALAQAPAEIGDAITKLVQDGVDGGHYIRSRLRQINGRTVRGRRVIRETTGARLVRILGDPELPQKTLNYVLS